MRVKCIVRIHECNNEIVIVPYALLRKCGSNLALKQNIYMAKKKKAKKAKKKGGKKKHR